MSRVNKTEITVFFLNARLFMISVKLYMKHIVLIMISAVRNIFIKADGAVTVDSAVLLIHNVYVKTTFQKSLKV